MKFMQIILAIFLVGIANFVYSDTLSGKFKEHLKEARKSIPGLELISDKAECKDLKLKRFQFDTGQKYTIVHPGEKVYAEMDYEIGTKNSKGINLHHYLYGLYPYGPIDCLLHSTGLRDSKGHVKISFTAPEEKGVYQLHICHTDKGLTYARAHKDWDENPSDNAIIGIVVVE